MDSNAAMMVFFSGPDVIATQIVQCGSAIKFVDSSCCQKESVDEFVGGEAV